MGWREGGVLGGDAQSIMVAACPRQGRTWRWAGFHFKLGRTGLPDGLDMRDEGKEVRMTARCVNQSQCWCHLRRCQDWVKQVWGHEVGCFPLSHTQAWDRENSSVCQQSHQPGLLFKWSLCVAVGFALRCVLGDSNQTCPRSRPSFPHVLLTSHSRSQQL